MAKKRISSVDLTWMIYEELKETGSVSPGISLAVVPDDKHGWRAVVAIRSRRFMTAQAERELAAVQKRLRLEYDLRS